MGFNLRRHQGAELGATRTNQARAGNGNLDPRWIASSLPCRRCCAETASGRVRLVKRTRQCPDVTSAAYSEPAHHLSLYFSMSDQHFHNRGGRRQHVIVELPRRIGQTCHGFCPNGGLCIFIEEKICQRHL